MYFLEYNKLNTKTTNLKSMLNLYKYFGNYFCV